MECHDPHAANREYVLKRPVQELCVGCHDEKPKNASQVEVISLEENADIQYLKLSSNKYVHEPAKKSCLICHDAHASEFPKELRVSVRDVCMDCHGPNAEKIVQSTQPFPLFKGLVSLPPKTFEKLERFELSGKYVHKPVDVSCAFCHDAHASDNESGLYSPITDLCIACHGPNGRALLRSKQPFPLFGGKVSVPPKSFDKLTTLDIIKGRFGHPTADHPIFVAATKDKAELNCASCHQSHSSSTGPKLLITDKKQICQKCHEL